VSTLIQSTESYFIILLLSYVLGGLEEKREKVIAQLCQEI
jgi:hypothetical protein